MEWVGLEWTFKAHLVPIPLQLAGTSSTRSGCSEMFRGKAMKIAAPRKDGEEPNHRGYLKGWKGKANNLIRTETKGASTAEANHVTFQWNKKYLGGKEGKKGRKKKE